MESDTDGERQDRRQGAWRRTRRRTLVRAAAVTGGLLGAALPSLGMTRSPRDDASRNAPGHDSSHDAAAARNVSGSAVTGGAAEGTCAPLLAHAPRPLGGGAGVPLCERFSGQVLLIVNTASKCGFTPQFDALEALNGRYAERGFSVLGFPSDDFRQELDEEADIASFCRLNYGVTFPMFQKVGVRASGAHPLYRDLAAEAGRYPDWNFNKYLVGRDGRVLGRYGSSVLPLGERLVGDIEAAL